MTDATIAPNTSNAWTAREPAVTGSRSLIDKYGAVFAAPPASLADVDEDDWFVLLDGEGRITRAGRVLRVRSELDRTIVYSTVWSRRATGSPARQGSQCQGGSSGPHALE
ncbi:hypothetical protein ACQ5SK_27070 [Bradyrhizobium japonicum]